MAEYDVSYEFTPDLSGVPEELIEDALDEIGTFLIESILEHVGEAKTPVSGGKYAAKLRSKAYIEMKGDDMANLDLTGDMLRALEWVPNGDSIIIGVFDKDQAPKAYNHNFGDTLPRRQFLPESDQNFKREILNGVKRIIEEYKGEG
jgi:hypothetical protein